MDLDIKKIQNELGDVHYKIEHRIFKEEVIVTVFPFSGEMMLTPYQTILQFEGDLSKAVIRAFRKVKEDKEILDVLDTQSETDYSSKPELEL